MARRTLTIDDVLESLLDDDFRLSERDSNDVYCGDDLYAYLSEPVVSRSDKDALTQPIVDNKTEVVDDNENDDHNHDDKHDSYVLDGVQGIC